MSTQPPLYLTLDICQALIYNMLMNLDDVIEHFGNSYQFSLKTKMSASNYWNWKAIGYIPFISQLRLEHLTKGALKANESEKFNQDGEDRIK